MIGRETGVAEIREELLPADKLEAIGELANAQQLSCYTYFDFAIAR